MTDFLIYSILVIITPGPNTILSMRNGIDYGFRRGIRFNYGHFAGFFAVMFLCLTVSKTLLSFLPQAKPVLLVLGIGYMLYQAWKCLTWKEIPDGEEGAADGGSGGRNLVIQGFLLQFINVKCLIFGISVFSNYVLTWGLPSYGQILVCLFLAVTAFACGILWLAAGSVLKRFFSRHRRILGIAMAAALVYCAVRMAL